MTEAISLPFSFSNGRTNSTTNDRKIWNDRVYTAITTSFYERLMSPVYGTELLSAVWLSLDDATTLVTKSISAAFAAVLSDLKLDNVSIRQVVDQNLGTASLIVTVIYTLPDGRTDEIVIKTATFNRYGEKIEGAL